MIRSEHILYYYIEGDNCKSEQHLYSISYHIIYMGNCDAIYDRKTVSSSVSE